TPCDGSRRTTRAPRRPGRRLIRRAPCGGRPCAECPRQRSAEWNELVPPTVGPVPQSPQLDRTRGENVKLVSFELDGRERVGSQIDGGIVDLQAAGVAGDVLELIAGGDAALEAAEAATADGAHVLELGG